MKLSSSLNLLKLLLRMTDIKSKLCYFSTHNALYVNHCGWVISESLAFVYCLSTYSSRNEPWGSDSLFERWSQEARAREGVQTGHVLSKLVPWSSGLLGNPGLWVRPWGGKSWGTNTPTPISSWLRAAINFLFFWAATLTGRRGSWDRDGNLTEESWVRIERLKAMGRE